MSDTEIARNVLPIPDPASSGLITYDAKDPDTRFPPIRDIRPPKGAPNVLVVLIDDVGFVWACYNPGEWVPPRWNKPILRRDFGPTNRSEVSQTSLWTPRMSGVAPWRIQLDSEESSSWSGEQ